MIILHKDDRVGTPSLLHHSGSKSGVDPTIFVPVTFPKRRTHKHNVAKRPQTLIGQAEVVAVLLVLREPHAAKRVGRRRGRYFDVVTHIYDIAVGGAAAMGNPNASARSHYGLDCRHKSACRNLQHDPASFTVVDIGLSVGNDDYFGIRKLAA